MSIYRSYSDGKKYYLKQGQLIGTGFFSYVTELENRKDFVSKTIPLTPKPNDQFTATREYRIKSTYNELRALKKLNLLEGYLREKDRITIVMRKLKGEAEITLPANQDVRPNTPRQFNGHKSVASFTSLLALNSKDVYHLNPCPNYALVAQKANHPHWSSYAASWIGFGETADYSWVNYAAQMGGFYHARGGLDGLYGYKAAIFTASSCYFLKKSARYLCAGILLGTGAGFVLGFHTTLLFAFDMLQPYFSHIALRELNALLDLLDAHYSKNINNLAYSKRTLRMWKLAIDLGYALLNVYALYNLYHSIQTFRKVFDLDALIQQLSSFELPSLTSYSSIPIPSLDMSYSYLYHDVFTPLVEDMFDIIHQPSRYALDGPSAILKKSFSEISYLYAHFGVAVSSFSNMLEHVLPADHLLPQADLVFQYNPKLLFAYAATRTKETLSTALATKDRDHNRPLRI